MGMIVVELNRFAMRACLIDAIVEGRLKSVCIECPGRLDIPGWPGRSVSPGLLRCASAESCCSG